MRLSPERSEELVLAAAKGDPRAWEGLVDAYAGLVWAIARNHRLGASDAADVSQVTWLRLMENIQRLREPSRVGAWLATTARRECLRLIGQARRVVLLPNEEDYDVAADTPAPDSALLAAERDEGVRAALLTLSPRCQQLLQLLMLEPPPSYEEISAAMGIPIGSIGPTRGRCLAHLHEILAAISTSDADRRSLDS